MATTYKQMQIDPRLDQLSRDLAMNFEIPARDLIQNAALDLGITVKALERLRDKRFKEQSA